MTKWTELVLRDADGNELTGDAKNAKLMEFRKTDGMQEVFFERLGAAHEIDGDPSTYGPQCAEEVDWEGFEQYTVRYYIDFGTGAGNEYAPTLEEAKQAAIDGASYTQADITIYECENGTITKDSPEVARLKWCGCTPDNEEDVVVDYGSFGYYAWA